MLIDFALQNYTKKMICANFSTHYCKESEKRLISTKNSSKSIYIHSIYIVYVAFFAFSRVYPMGILWEWYGNPMVRIAR